MSTRFGGHLAALLGAQRAIRGEDPSPEKLLLLDRQFDATVVATSTLQCWGSSTIREASKEVGMEFARYHMTEYKNLGLLAMVEDPAHRTEHAEDSPSWLPDPSAPSAATSTRS
ncbi:hypothetical protein VMCG_04541 [Cytospora schulzeri]|uniref:Uncharacterized protein n=1 Tax=Cytospora schulzeri TaxID=448051 RepID=A0A423WRE7_9PEZI|nr:hypothetical protein VMCG_04541 [Valsa malicola]